MGHGGSGRYSLHSRGAGDKALSTGLTFSLLAMVEEAVCAQAKAFVGTKVRTGWGRCRQCQLGPRDHVSGGHHVLLIVWDALPIPTSCACPPTSLPWAW